MTKTQGTFIPAEAAVQVRFARGMDRYSTLPPFVAKAGLTHRCAVIQDTYVQGCADTFFDASLWLALVEFLQSQGGEVTVLAKWRDRVEQPLSAFLKTWTDLDPEDQDAAWILISRLDDLPTLCMVTDYWCQVGGPRLYHDSYTYSLFAGRDLGREVITFLRSAPGSKWWRIDPETVEVTMDDGAPLLARLLKRARSSILKR